jgi:peptidoglycan/xylan/chitin deacetylase (PgdA/CDA1 family)
MTKPRTVFLMYHELELAGRTLCQGEPGYVRYVVHADRFREQMLFIKQQGWRGVAVGEALEYSANAVAITFDDGSETDLISAAPILREFGFGATFYITTGFLGRPGYLNDAQLRELSDQGWEIGCHSMTHPYLTDLDDKGLQREIADAKTQLEQIIGRPVEHFSCPGGRYDTRVGDTARRAGYRTVATSRLYANSAETDRFALGRVAVMRGTSPAAFADLCIGKGLRRQDLVARLLQGSKRLLGNSAYDRIRAAVLGQNSTR